VKNKRQQNRLIFGEVIGQEFGVLLFWWRAVQIPCDGGVEVDDIVSVMWLSGLGGFQRTENTHAAFTVAAVVRDRLVAMVQAAQRFRVLQHHHR